MSGIDETLRARDALYGKYADQAAIADSIKAAMRAGRNWTKLAPDMRESLDLIATKISRALNGDPECHDTWHDMQGYAKLVADRLAKK